MNEEKICVTCNSKFTIHHIAQRRKKYCNDRCSKGWHQPLSKEESEKKIDNES